MLSIQNLTASIEGKEILHDVTVKFLPGKTYALMGPNGSGKSTLASAIVGHPKISYKRNAKILSGAKNIKSLSPDLRAKMGIFLSFQTPLEIPGVTVFDLLRIALEKKMDAVSIHKKIREYAAELHIKEELLKRSLNEGFSGGERKKMEALQAAMLMPQFALFDEIDTGVDVDALKTISTFLKKHLPKTATLVFITHSTRLLKYVNPDEVIVMKNGVIAKKGKAALAKQIEQKGFEAV